MGEFDNLIDQETIESSSHKFKCNLTVMENGEHWFHTPEQLNYLNAWVERNIPSDERQLKIFN